MYYVLTYDTLNPENFSEVNTWIKSQLDELHLDWAKPLSNTIIVKYENEDIRKRVQEKISTYRGRLLQRGIGLRFIMSPPISSSDIVGATNSDVWPAVEELVTA